MTSATGQTQQGSLVQQNGQCPAQPKDCGSVANGQTTWQADGQTAPYQCGTCVDGSAHLCIAVLEEQMLCSNGTLSPTGQTQAGQVIGFANTCPNVIPGSETYQVPTAAPKADVLFVLDTTPTMFKTLVELSNRFRALISEWSNVDYQIGISNADPHHDWWDWHASGGHLMGLDVWPLQPQKPIRILTPSQEGAEWIFRRNVSFHGLSWYNRFPFCDQQPYCEDTPPEPLHEIQLTLTKSQDPANAGFFRSGSTFVPVIISANDERGGWWGDGSTTKPSDVVSTFNQRISGTNGMKAYSIIIQPGDERCLHEYRNIFQMGDGGQYGQSLDQFAKLTGGSSISICQNDYGKALADLSQAVRQQITSITLKHVPWGHSLQITFSPSISGITWVVSGQTVTFNKPLPPGTSLSIQYLYAPPSN